MDCPTKKTAASQQRKRQSQRFANEAILSALTSFSNPQPTYDTPDWERGIGEQPWKRILIGVCDSLGAKSSCHAPGLQGDSLTSYESAAASAVQGRRRKRKASEPDRLLLRLSATIIRSYGDQVKATEFSARPAKRVTLAVNRCDADADADAMLSLSAQHTFSVVLFLKCPSEGE